MNWVNIFTLTEHSSALISATVQNLISMKKNFDEGNLSKVEFADLSKDLLSIDNIKQADVSLTERLAAEAVFNDLLSLVESTIV